MKKLKYVYLMVAILGIGCSKDQLVPDDAKIGQGLNLNPLSGSAIAATGDGTLTDTNIKYFGRWDFSNTAQYSSYWGGAYLKVNFTGTTIKAKLGGIVTNYYARIDNGSWIAFTGVSGTVNLTPTPLAAGTHSLLLTEAKDSFYTFNFQGLILDTGAVTNAPGGVPDLVEWVGDSITAGWTDPRAEIDDYAWLCSDMMHTEHTQIAYPGIYLTSGYTGNPGMDTGYFKLKAPNITPATDWDFSRYTARMVVINLGTNDFIHQTVPQSNFQAAYITLLQKTRTKYPNATIFVMKCFYGGIPSAPIVAAVNARHSAGDDKLIYIDTSNWLVSTDYNDGIHPSAAGHLKIANLLYPILAPYRSTEVPLYLDNCDATTGWVSANTLSVNTTDKKEGTGALQSVGSGTDEFKKVFASPLNSGASATTGSIQFWYYVSDVTKLSATNQIEIGSGGAADVNEYSWNIGPLVNGWNLITKPFSTAGTTGGTPNLNAINWFRVYHSKTASVTTRIDGIRIIK